MSGWSAPGMVWVGLKRERRPDQLGLAHGQLQCVCFVSMSHGFVSSKREWLGL